MAVLTLELADYLIGWIGRHAFLLFSPFARHCHFMPPKRKPRKARSLESQRKFPLRNVYFDCLRGLAIVLMIVDHAAGLLFHTPIDYSTVRFGTRLSMPLFAILMGYFLTEHRFGKSVAERGGYLAQRWLQIFLAGVLTNLLYYPLIGVFDILAGLLICYLLFLLLKDKFVWLMPVILLYPYDPLNRIFDYPLTIVICLVAQGIVLRKWGLGPATLSAISLSLIGIALVGKPSLFVLLFSLPATLLLGLAAKSKGMTNPWLAWLGQRPLTAYVVQYYVLFAISQLTT
jgi:uncharacterized membrane protein